MSEPAIPDEAPGLKRIGDGEPARTETETFHCVQCGQPFERETLVLPNPRGPGYEPKRYGPPHCEGCSAEIAKESEAQAARIAEMGKGRTAEPLARLQAAGVNVRVFGRLTLDDMGSSLATEAARSFVRQVMRAGPYDAVRGLYLGGPTGVGKSQLAVSTLRALLEQGYTGSIAFDRGRSFITTVQDRYGSGSVDHVIDARRKAGVWLLDDIGTEKPTADAFRILEDILDARQGHPTILTSNLDPGALAEQWAPQDTQGRFASRLGPENYRAIVLDGDDRRFRPAA